MRLGKVCPCHLDIQKKTFFQKISGFIERGWNEVVSIPWTEVGQVFTCGQNLPMCLQMFKLIGKFLRKIPEVLEALRKKILHEFVLKIIVIFARDYVEVILVRENFRGY